MTKEEYVKIRNDSNKDTTILYHTLWEIEGKNSLSLSQFNEVFWTWVFSVVGTHNMPMFQYNTFLKLDKHFGV